MKKGISTLVATVLIILITVAAVAIIWVAVVPMINENIAFDELDGRVSVLSSGGYTVYDADEGIAIVQVKRDVDEGVMNRIKIIFMIGGDSYSSTVVAPGSGQTKTYTFDLSDYGEPSSVSVAPIFVSSSGREKEGSVNSRADFVFGEIDNVDADVYDLERDYFYEMPMTGLVSWWRFDGDVNDSVGENDGELVGGNLDGGVLNLDGDGDWVDLGETDITYTRGTVSVWLKPYDVWNDGLSWYVIYDSVAGFYPIDKHSGNALRILMSNTAGEWKYNVDFYPPGLIQNEWHHIVAVWDTSQPNSATMYLNKNILGSSVNSAFTPKLPVDLRIGGYSSNNYVNASYDNLMIYNSVLSEEEITVIYENQKK